MEQSPVHSINEKRYQRHSVVGTSALWRDGGRGRVPLHSGEKRLSQASGNASPFAVPPPPPPRWLFNTSRTLLTPCSLPGMFSFPPPLNPFRLVYPFQQSSEDTSFWKQFRTCPGRVITPCLCTQSIFFKLSLPPGASSQSVSAFTSMSVSWGSW